MVHCSVIRVLTLSLPFRLQNALLCFSVCGLDPHQTVHDSCLFAACRTSVAPGGHNILATAPVARRAHDGAITGLIQTPDTRRWVSAGTDNAVRVWSVADYTNSLLRFPGALNSARSSRQIAVEPSSQVRCSAIPDFLVQ
jgi:WD40 repeat protein